MPDESNVVLIIDDDLSYRLMLSTALSRAGFRTLEAIDGTAGIETFEVERPDMVLLDVVMPGMDGFKVCRLLKENESTRDIPILFLTVDSNVVHLARAFDCGATDYIRKPVNEIELQARVRVALRDRQLVCMLREQARIDALKEKLAPDDAKDGDAEGDAGESDPASAPPPEVVWQDEPYSCGEVR